MRPTNKGNYNIRKIELTCNVTTNDVKYLYVYMYYTYIKLYIRVDSGSAVWGSDGDDRDGMKKNYTKFSSYLVHNILYNIMIQRVCLNKPRGRGVCPGGVGGRTG